MNDPTFLKSLGDSLMWCAGIAVNTIGLLLIASVAAMAVGFVSAILWGIWMLGLGGQIVVGLFLFFVIAIGCGILGEYLSEKYEE
jgi:hypothetical protein